jgi:hypothetical protein
MPERNLAPPWSVEAVSRNHIALITSRCSYRFVSVIRSGRLATAPPRPPEAAGVVAAYDAALTSHSGARLMCNGTKQIP